MKILRTVLTLLKRLELLRVLNVTYIIISQVEGADEYEPDKEDKVKLSSEHNYEVKLDSIEPNVGEGTLSEFLEEPPEKVKHPEHGIGVLVEIDKDWGTFIYHFDCIKSEV